MNEGQDPRVEIAAREIVRQQFAGCVSWQDTTDTATSGDETTRRRALDLARAVLAAVDASAPPRLTATEARKVLAYWLPPADALTVSEESARDKLAAIAAMRGERG